jgi:tripartite-type tricarboxylate transporter receptor subunit TctC
MKLRNLAVIATFALLAATMSLPRSGQGAENASTFPSRPIMVIIPFSAGGPTDTLMRVLSERMSVSLGQRLIIENITGATGSIAVAKAVMAAPDGYTLSVGNVATHVYNAATFHLKYDLLKDLEPVALLPSSAFIVVSKKAVPAKNLHELIDWIKNNPNKVTMGTPGVGSVSHVGALLFEKFTGTQLQFVPYRGAAPAMQDLLGGHIDLMLDTALNCLPQIDTGAIRAYAVSAPTRLNSAPEIPTVDEAGLPGFYAGVWNGIWVPKGTPREIIAKINRAVIEALDDPAVRRRLADLGMELPPQNQLTPEALGTFQKAEADKWWPIIKAAHINSE